MDGQSDRQTEASLSSPESPSNMSVCLLVIAVPPRDCQPQEDRYCVCCVLSNVPGLAQFLAHSICSTNICGINE